MKAAAPQPELPTPRLLLRPFRLADAPDVRDLANDSRIAAWTLSIPCPYTLEDACGWLRGQRDRYEGLAEFLCAITDRAHGRLLGACGLSLDLRHERAELGYWLGVPFWGQGYMTEAATALLRHGFGTIGLQRVEACVFGGNLASARVLGRLGFRFEGRRRRHLLKWGTHRDALLYGLLREEWESQALADHAEQP